VDRFQSITAFARVVEAGSFVGAAARLDISVSAVSRQVAELEAHLDARLLNRTTRRLSLTESGRVFYERCVQLLADLDEAEQSAGAGAVRPRGTLRITCGTTFGERHLAPAIADFLERYPDMRFDVDLSDRASDLVDEGFDCAVRIGTIGSQNLVGRKIGQTRLVCCASPEYLAKRGEPRVPEDLTAHACLTYEYSPLKNIWPFRDAGGRDRSVKVAGPVHANYGAFLAALAAAGSAVVIEPDFLLGPDVRAGRLIPILREFEPPAANIYVVYPSRRNLSAKVRAFTDFLSARFVTPDWILQPPRTAVPR
jgi:DNA-binding transcriptional LysR family regulator